METYISDGGGFLSLTRSEIDGDNDALVALFPSKMYGIEFLQENNAWGFVKMSQEPDYVGIYISDNIQEISYFGEVGEIVPAEEASLSKPTEEYESYNSGKKVIYFKHGEIYELEDKIPFESRVLYPPARYTSLEEFKNANTMDDVL